MLWDLENLKLEGPYKLLFPSGNYSLIEMHFNVIRRGTMIQDIVIVPGLMISFMIILAFYLPTVAPIRLVFSTTVMLTLIMFLNLVAYFLPINNEFCFIEKTFY